MTEFQFAHPTWLYAAWLVLLCAAVLVLLELRGRNVLVRMMSPLMQSRLVHKVSLLRRLLSIGLFSLALLALVFALMRPQWGRTVQRMTRVESQVMICLDVSKSMLAEDVVPNRLERAKAEIDSLLALMSDGQQVGLTVFAGKATVLCPLTTDFGFLRLILAEAEPSSIGVGGTRIGDALAKATDGFREAGDVNRLILLITDGEDHDSFPLDAAEKAKEKGVRIVSVGFGDENGSKIEITDPTTGARKYIQDRNGVDVVSRLDGQTLRDIALKTQGAYIPAGTGALDLRSIYDAHIKSLLSGSDSEQERVIRNEAYQWCVLAAIILFIVSQVVRRSFAVSPSMGMTPARTKPTGITMATNPQSTTLALLLASVCWTQATAQVDSPVSKTEDAAVTIEQPDGESESDLTPRERYNLGVRLISTDPDRAERLLTEARNDSDVDGELRYRALYNLGWVEVARGDALVDSEPENALKRFELAAGRFRDALRIRPDSDEARHNLEVIGRRIIELRDALRKENKSTIEDRLDELILTLRDHQLELQSVASSAEAEDTRLQANQTVFRKLGIAQRGILSELEQLTADARDEVAALPQGDQDQPTPEQQVRRAQLMAMLNYVDRGIQRLSKSRSFTRRGQAERAFIRWASGLSDAKRGRDQLRNPVETISVLITDAGELARLTQNKQQAASPILDTQNGNESEPGATATASATDGGPRQTAAPAWLSTEYLLESQTAIQERTAELAAILAAGLEQNAAIEADATADSLSQEEAAANSAEPDQSQAEQSQAEQKAFMESVRLAQPFIDAAADAFASAATSIESEDLVTGLENQGRGITALMQAAEYFYDLRRLIEATYADEQLVLSFAEAVERSVDPTIVPIAAELQGKNLKRTERLQEMIKSEMDALANAATDGSDANANPPASEEETANEMQRFEIAQTLLEQIRREMTTVEEKLNRLADLESVPPAAEPEAATESAKESTSGSAVVTNEERPPSPKTTLVENWNPNETGSSAAVTNSAADLQATTNNVLAARQAATSAVDKTAELRRLFFSLIEHLRDTTQRQATLNDETIAASGLELTAKALGPLQERQKNLQDIALEIADALQQQSEQAASQSAAAGSADAQTDPTGPSPQDAMMQGEAAEQVAAATEKMAKASELVAEGSAAMADAVDSLMTAAGSLAPKSDDTEHANGPEPTTDDADAATQAPDARKQTESETPEPDLAVADAGESDLPASRMNSAFESQSTAFQKLLEALQLLDENQSDDDQQQQDQSDGEDQQQNQPSPSQQPQQPQSMNAEQILQAIRDREAQRRKDKQRSQVLSSGGVEKDW